MEVCVDDGRAQWKCACVAWKWDDPSGPPYKVDKNCVQYIDVGKCLQSFGIIYF